LDKSDPAYTWAGASLVLISSISGITTQDTHGDRRLFDVPSSEVVWSVATTTVTNRGNVPAMIDQFVRLIVDTLKKDSLI
jgi:hypothetical protein